jgi:MarR family transcriptional regulator for hemolysin
MSFLTSDEQLEVARELGLLARLWRQQFDLRLKALDLGEARWAVLYRLSQTPDGLSQSALADRVGVDAATLVRTIDLLQAQGLVQRRTSARDRRVNVVVLTDESAPILSQAVDQCERLWQGVMSVLSTEEQRSFLDLMRRVRVRLESLGVKRATSLGGP